MERQAEKNRVDKIMEFLFPPPPPSTDDLELARFLIIRKIAFELRPQLKAAQEQGDQQAQLAVCLDTIVILFRVRVTRR